MDTYRRLHGPFPPCESVRYLKRLYEAAYPRLPCNEADCSIEELTRQERAMFISQKDVEEILREQVGGKSAVDIILECICDRCTKLRTQDTYGTTELARLATDILKHCRVLFATLIYLGFSQLIGGLRGGFLAQPPLIQDSNLDAMGEWLKQNKRNYPLLPRGFEESYFVALKLFTAPIFELQSKFHHADDCRFPFLDESMHAEGSFGTVRKFNIHPHFIGKDVRRLETLGPAIFGYEKALKNGSKIPHVFARKTLKMEKGSRFDGKMKMEYDTLLVISAMRCKNIVQLVSFYTWRQEINFIFPFVEGNLEKLLRGEWSPTGLPSGPQQMPYHWLWKQMIGVADALHWIHEPTVPENLKGRLRGSKIIAFHLDLKPANILISRDAILQITDFGQSMIKMVPQGTSEYGIYIGGDQAYQPPESSVSRGGVNRLSFITNEIPLDHARSASSAPFKIEDLHESLKIDSNFDVWSLACIMVEVLVYISKNGKDGFLEFERTRQAEMPAVPFHKNGENGEKCLKECVELTLERLGNGNIAWATPNSSNEPQLLYMDALTTLIAEMFKVDPKLRPDSWKVAQKLKDLDTEFNDNNGILLSKLDNALEKEGTPGGFYELGWYNERTVNSFRLMKGVRVRAFGQAENHSPASIRIFENEKWLCIMKGSLPSIIIRPEHYQKSEARFVPIYLYDETRPYTCGLLGELSKVEFSFNSQLDLFIFQATVLHHTLANSIRIKQISIKPTRGVKEKKAKEKNLEVYKVLDDQVPSTSKPLCQIWESFDPPPVFYQLPPLEPKPSKLSQVENLQVPRCRTPISASVVLFLGASNGFIHFPLHGNDKVMQQGQRHEDVTPPDTPCMTIEPRQEARFQAFHVMRHPHEPYLNHNLEAPPISMRFSSLQETLDQKEIKRRKTDYAVLTFINHADVQQFGKTICELRDKQIFILPVDYT